LEERTAAKPKRRLQVIVSRAFGLQAPDFLRLIEGKFALAPVTLTAFLRGGHPLTGFQGCELANMRGYAIRADRIVHWLLLCLI
jgi:hypothetical protein